jgi:hypothetical protein
MSSKSTEARAARVPVTLEAEAQQVLDELWSEKAIPINLTVGKLTKDPGRYTIHFHDSRIRTAHIPLTEKHSFKDMVREAVLARVAQMSGPLGSKIGRPRSQEINQTPKKPI